MKKYTFEDSLLKLDSFYEPMIMDSYKKYCEDQLREVDLRVQQKEHHLVYIGGSLSEIKKDFPDYLPHFLQSHPELEPLVEPSLKLWNEMQERYKEKKPLNMHEQVMFSIKSASDSNKRD